MGIYESDAELAKKKSEVEKAKAEYEQVQKKHREDLFEKYGYEILENIKYNSRLLIPGERNFLSDLSSEEIKHLIAEKIISR